jgi:peptide/nickel transport system substrate-binding protein
MKKLLILSLAVILLAGMILAGCGESEPSQSTSPATTSTPTPTPTPGEPQYGGVLKIISTLCPSALGWPVAMLGYVDSTCMRPCLPETLLNLDKEGHFIPGLATAWEYSPDLKSITLTLRQGVKFHDGTDFNAEAAKYNIDLYRELSTKAAAKLMTSVDVIDDYTVRLNLSRFESTFIFWLTWEVGRMASPKALERGKEACMFDPVGTGPFKFDSFVRDVSLKFKRFDDYWQKGKPYLDGIEFDFIADPMAAKASFLAGEAQVIIQISPSDALELQQIGMHIYAPPTYSVLIAGDGEHPDSPFADVRVRQAVSYAIDNKAIVDTLGHGFLRATNQLAAPGQWDYNPAVVGYPHNPEKARELLAKAGYPNGFETKLILLAGRPEYADLATMVQAYLAEVNINAKLETVDFAKFTEYSIKSGWENGLLLTSMAPLTDIDPVDNMVSALSSKDFVIPSTAHYDDLDAKIFAALEEPDFDKKAALMQEVMKLVVDEHCVITYIYQTSRIVASHPEVHDLDILDPWSWGWHPDKVWLSK